MHQIFLCCLFLLISFPSPASPAEGMMSGPTTEFTLLMPSNALQQTLQNLLPLPLPIPSGNTQIQGDITISAIDSLRVFENGIFLKGTVSGKNLIMTTSLAGQDLILKLGQIELPVSGDLKIRYDAASKTLLVTPYFHHIEQDPKNPASALSPLLASLGDREYPVPLHALQPFHTRIGDRIVPITMEPTGIIAAKEQLIVRLAPQISKSH